MSEITYGQSISWHDRQGARYTVTVDGYETPEEAKKQALRRAAHEGWKLKRWFEWWRWQDRDP